MTTADRVRSARNPQEAMLALAEALDQLLASPKPEAAPDPWGSWSVNDNGSVTVPYEHYAQQSYAANRADLVEHAIQATRDQLASETDPETRAALEALLRLLTDDGAAVEQPSQGARVQSIDAGNEIVVDIPPPDAKRAAQRRKFVEAAGLYDFVTQPVLTKEEFNAAYVKGGPMWLYLGDRDAVMAMPEQMRYLLVADIEQDSPVQAQEVARDILKDAAAGSADATLGRLYE
jgi:hypothetical protein